jgi:hypothetical protein
MSLAVLARKTKTKQRLKSTTCGNGRSRNGQQGRSVGFVLNMTGRGGGIGLSGMSYKQRGSNCKQGVGCSCKGCCSGNCETGQAGTCCTADKIVTKKRREDCGECWYGGMSQPAPQMSYRNYINRKASGAYRPGGMIRNMVKLSLMLILIKIQTLGNSTPILQQVQLQSTDVNQV